MKTKRTWICLAIFMIACLLIGIIGSLWTKESVSTWYQTINKPSWTPPDFIFAPVWSLLYIMIAISGWLVYEDRKTHKRSIALKFYFGQLALNCIWSFLFFFLRSPLLGLIDITLLCTVIILNTIYAYQVRPWAGLILIPYLLWVSYATSLNLAIWMLNKA